MTRSLLITGGAGFIGANFSGYWSERHPEDRIVVLDVLTYAGNFSSIEPLASAGRISFVHGDIRDFDLVSRLLRENAVDTIVHFAAESHVDRSIEGPAVFVSTNVIGTQTLLDAARTVWLQEGRQRGAHRFHHVSTDEVYGSLGPQDAPFTERSPYAPSSPYAASKAASDHLVRAYARTYGLQCSISNCSNNYGPYQLPEKLIPLCLINMLHGKPLPIYGAGQNVRDWLYVLDHCRAVEHILLGSGAGETWNIGGSEERTNVDLVRLLCGLMDAAFAADAQLATRFPGCPAASGTPCAELVTFVADRPGHDFRYAIDSRHIEARLGFRPGVDLRAGLRHTVEWYLAHESWWRGATGSGYDDWIRRQYSQRAGTTRRGEPR